MQLLHYNVCMYCIRICMYCIRNDVSLQEVIVLHYSVQEEDPGSLFTCFTRFDIRRYGLHYVRTDNIPVIQEVKCQIGRKPAKFQGHWSYV